MTLVFSERAKKELLFMDTRQQRRIQEGIDKMLLDLRAADVKKLKGLSDQWRLRVGDWRIIFEIDQIADIILIHRIVHRKEAYR